MEPGDAKPSWWQKGMRERPNGLIEWRFYVDGPTGAKRVSAYGTTITELKRERARIERRSEAAAENIRLNELLDRYLAYRDEEGYDKRASLDIKSKFQTYVRPKLGRLDLAELCTSWSVIGNHFNELSKQKPNSRTLQQTFDELRRAFRYAIENQWCSINPCENVKRPQYTSRDREPFTVAQVFELLDKARDVTRVMIFFLVTTACRPGEMYGLRVRDLNLLHREVYLRTFVYRDEKGVRREKTTGKTKRAVRTIPLIDPLVDALARYLAAANLGPDDYLFPNEHGGLISENNWRSRIFRPLAIAVGKPDAHPYDLRHTCNSFLADLGVSDEVRAAICGHSEAVNRKVYTHFSQRAKREAMTKLGALFDRNGGTNGGTEEVEAAG